MERAVAIKTLSKLLGKKFGYRVDPKASTPEQKENAKALLPSALEQRNKLKEAKEARFNAILAADTEYQDLKAAHKAAQDSVSKLNSIMYHRKITVGLDEGFFFLIKAEGDSWEQVIEKLQKKEGA